MDAKETITKKFREICVDLLIIAIVAFTAAFSGTMSATIGTYWAISDIRKKTQNIQVKPTFNGSLRVYDGYRGRDGKNQGYIEKAFRLTIQKYK